MLQDIIATNTIIAMIVQNHQAGEMTQQLTALAALVEYLC